MEWMLKRFLALALCAVLMLGACEGALATSADGTSTVKEEVTDEVIARKISLLILMIEDRYVTEIDDEFKDLMAFFKANPVKVGAWLSKFGFDNNDENSLIHIALQSKPLENKCSLTDQDVVLTDVLKGFLKKYKDSLPPPSTADSLVINLRENGDSATFIPEKPKLGDQYYANLIPFTPFVNNTSGNIMISAGTMYAVKQGTEFLKEHGLEVAPDGMCIDKNKLVLPSGFKVAPVVDKKTLKSNGFSFTLMKNGEPLMDIGINLFSEKKIVDDIDPRNWLKSEPIVKPDSDPDPEPEPEPEPVQP